MYLTKYFMRNNFHHKYINKKSETEDKNTAFYLLDS